MHRPRAAGCNPRAAGLRLSAWSLHARTRRRVPGCGILCGVSLQQAEENYTAVKSSPTVCQTFDKVQCPNYRTRSNSLHYLTVAPQVVFEFLVHSTQEGYFGCNGRLVAMHHRILSSDSVHGGGVYDLEGNPWAEKVSGFQVEQQEVAFIARGFADLERQRGSCADAQAAAHTKAQREASLV